MKRLSAVFLLALYILALASCSFKKADAPAVVNSDEYAVFQSEETGLFGYKDKDGSIVIDCQFENALPFSEGRAIVQKNHRFAYIDEKGNPVTDFIFTSAGKFSNSRAVVTGEDNKCGYIDKDGNLVIECIYDVATNFNENGIAVVVLAGRELTIDLNGNEVIAG